MEPAEQSSDSTGRDATIEPFESGPAHLSGCRKPVVIGCVALLVLVGISLVILVTQSPRLLRWSMGKMQEHVEAGLPDDLSAAERQRLDAAFAAAAEAMASGSVDPTAFTQIQRLSSLLPQTGQTLTAEQVAEISGLLEGIAGIEAPSTPQSGLSFAPSPAT